MAGQLDKWAGEITNGRLLLAVCLLRGGVFFYSDVLQRMRHSVEPAFCRAWSYAKGRNLAPEGSVRLDWQGLALQGRDVVLIDNICDSGRTFAVAADQATAAGARSVRTLAIVRRVRADAVHAPTLCGFYYSGPEWLVGYGLRDGEACANFPEIYRHLSAHLDT